MTRGFILVPADGAVRPAKGVCTVLTCTGVLVVGDTCLGERGREAPKSQRTRGVIEASANMGKNVLECARALRVRPPWEEVRLPLL
jgi:hypothetical protein